MANPISEIYYRINEIIILKKLLGLRKNQRRIDKKITFLEGKLNHLKWKYSSG